MLYPLSYGRPSPTTGVNDWSRIADPFREAEIRIGDGGRRDPTTFTELGLPKTQPWIFENTGIPLKTRDVTRPTYR
jgi:hypothetical protein